ncbi:MAG: hypothetical protein JWN91_1788 [Nocardioides sp.]|jgi:hypothetical protein|nr:hypothetical protein [Nocardioides sp.]
MWKAVVRRRWAVAGLVIALMAVAFAGFAVGRGSRVVTEDVGCLSAEGVIGCTLRDGWDVSVPLDVAWTDAQGTFHQGGRPQCLPPTGRGLEGPVRIAWTKVEAGGIGWRQVVWSAA